MHRQFVHFHRMRTQSGIHLGSEKCKPCWSWTPTPTLALRHALLTESHMFSFYVDNYATLTSINYNDTYWINIISSWWLWVECVLSIHSVSCAISLTNKHIVNAISTHHLVCRHSNGHPSLSLPLQLKLKCTGATQYPLGIGSAGGPVTTSRKLERCLKMEWNVD